MSPSVLNPEKAIFLDKAVIFLDIDGVLNALDWRKSFVESAGWDDFKVTSVPAMGHTFDLLLSRAMADALNALPAKIVWVTTWQGEAYKVGELLDIEADYLELSSGWKLYAVQRFLRFHPVPFVWIDDDECDDWNIERVKHMHPDVPGLFIRPNALTGITPTHIETIKQFLKENT